MKHFFTLKSAIILSIAFGLTLTSCSKKNNSNPTPEKVTVTSLSATQGPYNTNVVITGTAFSSTIANDKVFFNGKAATITAATTTQLTVTVPLGAGTGSVTVSVNNGAAAPGPVFTYQLSSVVTTFAGSASPGSANGKGAAASFSGLWGVAIDPLGNLFVTDGYLLRKITPGGTVSFFAGNSTTLGKDGKGAGASFEQPSGMVCDASGNLYIADIQSVRKVTPDGTVTTVPGSRFNNGNADFTGVVLDASGNIYASDVQNNVIVEIKPDGTSSIFAGSGTKTSVDGKGTAASFASPVGLAIDASGNLYVVDEYSNKIRKITPDGTVTTIAGTGSKGAADGKGSLASFNDPTGVIVDATGILYIGDFNNYRIRKITPDGTVSTIAGSSTEGFTDGIGIEATFGDPQGLVFDTLGNIYVADALAVRKITFQ